MLSSVSTVSLTDFGVGLVILSIVWVTAQLFLDRAPVQYGPVYWNPPNFSDESVEEESQDWEPNATTFKTTRIGDQFTILADAGEWVFERINMTEDGNNARCDAYDTLVHDFETITLISLPIR